MRYWALAFLLFGLGMLVLLMASNVDRARDRIAAEQRESVWKARYAAAVVEAERVADTVVRTVTRTKTLRDSVLFYIHDTARIQEFVYQTDTLVVSCERCAKSLLALRATSDSLLAAKDLRIAALKPSRWDRVRPYVWAGVAFYVGSKVRVR